MNYSYSQHNRLEEPHSYMYTPFEGAAFLGYYLSSRIGFLHSAASNSGGTHMPDQLLLLCGLRRLERDFDAASPSCGVRFRELSAVGAEANLGSDKADEAILSDLGGNLTRTTIASSVTTLDLLCALIGGQLTDAHLPETKLWLDRLVQRFEVTKKLFDVYPPGFRKGQGLNTSVRLYWLLALGLCLFHSSSNQIKYLSTLLKVCDLLCSLPGSVLAGEIPRFGMSAVLAAEMSSVRLLAERKGLTIAPE